MYCVVCCCLILSEGLGKIEDLQGHENEQIYRLAAKLIDSYFEVEETVTSSDGAAQQQPQGATQSLDFVVNGTPDGGFKF